MFRLLHTADWHLGQTLHGVSRAFEHARFLDWLLDQIERHSVDALIVAGDIFDVASPSAAAQAQYFSFLAEARRRHPALEVAVLGGNHDAAARLDAARTVLDALRIRVVGGLPWAEGAWDLDRLFVPFGSDALLIAVPFLKPRDLPRSRAEARAWAGLPPEPDAQSEVASASPDRDPPFEDAETPIALGHRWIYEALVEAARARRKPGAALIATGHAYVSGSQLSELSERKIQQGNQQALPASTFPSALAYVALGHLHLAQTVGEAPVARYSGSPIPLSMAELDYPHQVLLVDLDGEGLQRVTPARVPRFVELLRIPETPASFEEVQPLLAALPRRPNPPPSEEERPLLEVRIRLDTARPRLRQEVEGALEGAWARLVRIDVTRPESHDAPLPARELSSLSAEEVFVAAHARVREAPPSPDLMTCFRELLEEVERTP